MRQDFQQAGAKPSRRYDDRLKSVIDVIASVEIGRALLDVAAAEGVTMRLVRQLQLPKTHGHVPMPADLAGFYLNDPLTGKKEIQLLAACDHAQLVPFLVHELRHVQQAARLGITPMLAPAFPNLREIMLMQRVIEGDAQVLTYLFCNALEAGGKPEYMQAFRGASRGAEKFSLKDMPQGGNPLVHLFASFQRHETHTYDTDLRVKMNAVAKKFPAELHVDKNNIAAVFNSRIRMRDIGHMTKIGTTNYLGGLARSELEAMIDTTRRPSNRAFLDGFEAKVKAAHYGGAALRKNR